MAKMCSARVSCGQRSPTSVSARRKGIKTWSSPRPLARRRLRAHRFAGPSEVVERGIQQVPPHVGEAPDQAELWSAEFGKCLHTLERHRPGEVVECGIRQVPPYGGDAPMKLSDFKRMSQQLLLFFCVFFGARNSASASICTVFRFLQRK